jgi:hypothetical protein
MMISSGTPIRERHMPGSQFVYWEEDGAWLGYLQDYPDYWTQGDTLDNLKEHLEELHDDLSGRSDAGAVWAK